MDYPVPSDPGLRISVVDSDVEPGSRRGTCMATPSLSSVMEEPSGFVASTVASQSTGVVLPLELQARQSEYIMAGWPPPSLTTTTACASVSVSMPGTPNSFRRAQSRFEKRKAILDQALHDIGSREATPVPQTPLSQSQSHSKSYTKRHDIELPTPVMTAHLTVLRLPLAPPPVLPPRPVSPVPDWLVGPPPPPPTVAPVAWPGPARVVPTRSRWFKFHCCA